MSRQASVMHETGAGTDPGTEMIKTILASKEPIEVRAPHGSTLRRCWIPPTT